MVVVVRPLYFQQNLIRLSIARSRCVRWPANRTENPPHTQFMSAHRFRRRRRRRCDRDMHSIMRSAYSCLMVRTHAYIFVFLCVGVRLVRSISLSLCLSLSVRLSVFIGLERCWWILPHQHHTMCFVRACNVFCARACGCLQDKPRTCVLYRVRSM